MSEEIAVACADLVTVERLRARLQERDAELHDRNGELLVARMALDMLRDDVRPVIAMLPQYPGTALVALVEALRSQNAQEGPCTGRGAMK